MSAVKYNYNMSYDAIDKGIESVAKRTTKMREDIHKIAVSVLVRWNETGDAATASAKASALLESVDKYKAQAVVNWFSIYAGFVYSTETKEFSYTNTTIELEVKKGAIYVNGDDKALEPYWKVTPPKAPQPFDLPGKLQNLIAQAEKRREKGLQDGDDIPSDVLKKLKDALAA